MTSRKTTTRTVVGTILEEEVVLTLDELTEASRLSSERVVELVQEGVIEPDGNTPESWRFRGVELRRVRCARRLERDLGVNAPGIALALDLLEELKVLRERLERLER